MKEHPELCPRCGEPMVGSCIEDGSIDYYCVHCQKPSTPSGKYKSLKRLSEILIPGLLTLYLLKDYYYGGLPLDLIVVLIWVALLLLRWRANRKSD